jgi:hypothetical protein
MKSATKARLKITGISTFCFLALTYGTIASANKTECSSAACTCEVVACPTCAGSYCVGSNITCSAEGDDMSCGAWCVNLWSGKGACNGQSGASECCTGGDVSTGSNTHTKQK